MGLRTILKFFVGDAAAIRLIARNRFAVWIGLLFVISAGFAREYDGEYLLAEPWHLLAPVGASLLTSLILFAILEFSFNSGSRGRQKKSFGRAYRSFLGLYWMTAPMAWLYALPVERWFDAGGSVRANLSLLGIVSLWRVVLMMHVVYVVYRRTIMSSVFVVLLFADLVAMGVLWMTPLPILSIMGGIRLTESEQLIQSVAFMIGFWGIVTLPVWLIGHGVTRARGSKTQAMNGRRFLGESTNGTATKTLWATASLSIAIWLLILPTTQQEQQHRWTAESLLQSGEITKAIRYMSARARSDFPPHWDPPPRIGYGERVPNLVDVLLVCEEVETREWVRSAFREKLLFQSKSYAWSYQLHAVRIRQMSDRKLEDYIEMLSSWPRGEEVAAYHQHELQSILEEQQSGDPKSDELSRERRELLSRLLDLAPETNSDS